MKTFIQVTMLSAAALVLSGCYQQASTAPGSDDGRMSVCPADQMQNLVGKKATEASKYLSKVPADERTPTYYIGRDQKLPDSVTRGSTLVVLNTPIVNPNPDLSAYTVIDVKCFTGSEWAN